MSPAPYDEQATLRELVFALGGRDEPTVALVECASLAKRRELEAELAARMPEYQFYQLDVTPYAVTSLLGTLTERLPAAVRASRPVSWVVNVHGLENSLLLSQDGQLLPSPLTAQLNLERELLFRRVPYLLLLWGDADFFRALQREAPDFWHWATYRFRFEDHTARPVAALPPLPPERLPGPGNVAERQARITELRERYDHLALDDSDKKRLLKDKIDILSLLGAEYREAFMYPEAVDAYKMAIALQERLQVSNDAQAELWFQIGYVYLQNKSFSESIAAYEHCKELSADNSIAVIFHQIGLVYHEQDKWELALDYYLKALDWEQRVGDTSKIGSTYHQIGKLYGAQAQWTLALDNYRQALKWKRLSNDNLDLGSTYHQIGITYHYQREWTLALKNYRKSLEWEKRTGNEYATCTTSQLIGRIHTEQNRYVEAILWLRRSVACLAKYGHPLKTEAESFLAIVMQLAQSQQVSKYKKASHSAKPKSTQKKRIKIASATSVSKPPPPRNKRL